MMKANLSIQETLSYRRTVKVELPDEMDENDFENLLDWIEKEPLVSVIDYLKHLERNGITIIEKPSDDPASPYDVKVECDELSFGGDD